MSRVNLLLWHIILYVVDYVTNVSRVNLLLWHIIVYVVDYVTNVSRVNLLLWHIILYVVDYILLQKLTLTAYQDASRVLTCGNLMFMEH